MTIHLPKELEGPIREGVLSGHFASEDDLVAEAVRDYLQRRQKQAPPPAQAANPADARAHKPIWEEILELTADVPDEEWDKLPTDLAEQHDHYIYGTPKRPTS
jgi:Arc/MetJ-type ribon-helix-helix transcriptional regulator